jgi:hypothetical protein
VISDASEEEVYPAVAYNSERREYLVVWYNDRAGCHDIRAQQLSAQGALLGGPFYISAECPAERRYPDVTYNRIHDQYLVVWEQYDASSGYSIQARRISGTGSVLDNADIELRGASNLYTPVRPAVAYAYSADRYLVVWAETWHPIPITYDIYGQVVDATGNADAPFSVSQGDEPRQAPDVAYNRHANRYLVVWQQQDDTTSIWDIHSQQVHGGGGMFGSDVRLAYYTRSSTNPAVAAIPTTPSSYKFLVTWELDYASGDHDIYGILVQEDGTPNPSDIKIALGNGVDETCPAIAATEDGLRYFVTWRSAQGVVDNPIKGRFFSYTGVPTSEQAEFSGVAADHPAVAAGPVGDFLTVWQDQPIFATNSHLYGQLWGNRVFLPLMLRNYP